MKASDYIIQTLADHKISKVFGYIGGMIAHLTDSLYTSESVEMVNCIHEQGAGFAAEGYARVTGKYGVAIATSGPGATNLLTPLASCFFDSTPVLFITGQVNTNEYRKYPHIRQCGFQETNIVDMAKPVAKYAKLVDNIEDLRYELEKALHIMKTGRKGPVLLDIPMDIQRQEFVFETARSFDLDNEQEFRLPDITELIQELSQSKKPIILSGNGTRLSNCVQKLRTFVKKNNIPIVQSLLGLDSCTSDYTYNLGMIGTYGNRAANLALANSDFILAIGSRLDIRQIGAKAQKWAKGKIIFQIDIDQNELDTDQVEKKNIHSDAAQLLTALENHNFHLNISGWLEKIIWLKKSFFTTVGIDGKKLIPNQIVQTITALMDDDDVICADVGQHQMWVGQSAIIKQNTRLLSSGGLGSMGFALPCAIGSAIAGKHTIVFTGDGGFQMNIQELEVIKRRNLPIKIIILNNNSLGMVRSFQELYFGGRLASTVEDYSAPDFTKISKAYGIEAIKVDAENLTNDLIIEFLTSNSPKLLDIKLSVSSQVEPKVLFGNNIDNMHPLLTDEMVKKIQDHG